MFGFKLKLIRNRKGFQLLDVVASLGLSSLTAVFMQSYLLMQNTELQKTQRAATRETLVEMIKLNTNMINIRRTASSPLNHDLNNCLINNQLCKSLELKPFILFSLNSDLQNQFAAISGTEQSPQLYDASGTPCAVGSKEKRCIYEVTTNYRVQCKPDLSTTFQPATTCMANPVAGAQGIELVEIFYRVRPTDVAKAEVMKGQWQEFEGSIIIPFTN
jgi:hypothetical protein